MALLQGCSLFSPVEIVKHPDAPMQILQVGRSRVRVAVYDKSGNQMIEYGWVEIEEGWTLHRYDWEAYIEKHKDD